jgi:hypothetical protein
MRKNAIGKVAKAKTIEVLGVFSQMSDQDEKKYDWKGRNGENDRSFVCAVRRFSQMRN